MFNYVVNGPIVPRLSHITTIGDFLGIAVNILLGVGISLSVIFIGIAGVRYITAGGNPDEVQSAQRALTYSVVAMVLTIGAVAIKYIFLGILGVDDPNLINPTPNF